MLSKNKGYLTFYILWITATMIGTACIGLFFATAQTTLNQMLDKNAPIGIIAGVIVLVAGVTILGRLQAVVLRQHLSPGRGWMSATVVGMILALLVVAIIQFVGSMFGFYADSLIGRISFLAGAIVFGLIQRRVLKKWVANSGWWVFATVIAYFIGSLGSSSLNFFATGLSEPAIVTLSFAIGGCASGLVTGFALIWLIESTP